MDGETDLSEIKFVHIINSSMALFLLDVTKVSFTQPILMEIAVRFREVPSFIKNSTFLNEMGLN